jgi:hypothetical protein
VGWKHRRVHGQVRANAVVLSPPSRDALRQKQSRRGPFGAAGLDLSRRGNLRSRARCGVPCVFFWWGFGRPVACAPGAALRVRDSLMGRDARKRKRKTCPSPLRTLARGRLTAPGHARPFPFFFRKSPGTTPRADWISISSDYAVLWQVKY